MHDLYDVGGALFFVGWSFMAVGGVAATARTARGLIARSTPPIGSPQQIKMSASLLRSSTYPVALALLASAAFLPTPTNADAGKIPPRMLSAEQFHDGVELLWDRILTRHPKPFRLYSRAEFQAEIDRLTHRSFDISEAEAFVEVSKVVGMLPDGHSWVSIDDDSLLFSKAMPLRFWQFSDGIYVRAAAPEYASLVGAEVLSIDGVPIAKAWKQVREAVGGGEQVSTTRAQIHVEIPAFLHALKLADGADEAVFEFRLQGGKTINKTVRARQYKNYSEVWNSSAQWATPDGWVEPSGAKQAPWFGRREAAFWSTYLPETRSLYVAFNKATIDPDNPWDPVADKYRPFLEELFKRAQRDDVERLIIDLRNNNGGDSALWQPLVHHIIRTEKLYEPGRLFVITSRLTESAAVAWAARIEMHSPALFIGEPTVNPPNFDNDPAGWRRESYHVPGSAINVRIANMNEYWSDATDDRNAIYPDIPAFMSWGDFAHGRDPALRAIQDVTIADAKRYFMDEDGESLLNYPWMNFRRKSQTEMMKNVRRASPP